MGGHVSKRAELVAPIHQLQITSDLSTQTNSSPNRRPKSCTDLKTPIKTKSPSYSHLPLNKRHNEINQNTSSSDTTKAVHSRASSDPMNCVSPKKSMLDLMHEQMHKDFLLAKEKKLKEEADVLERKSRRCTYQIIINGAPMSQEPKLNEDTENLIQ